MSDEWKFASKIMLTKGELLQLDILAGDKSISEYLENLVRQHIQDNISKTGGEESAYQQAYYNPPLCTHAAGLYAVNPDGKCAGCGLDTHTKAT